MASEEPGHKSADAGMEQGVPAVPSSAPSQPNSASQEGNLLGMDTAVPESLASEPPAPDHAPEQDESESKQGFHAETALEYASESPSKEKPVRDEEETSPQPVPAPNEAAAPAAEVQNAEVAPAETLAPVERSNEHASSENRAPLGDATSTADSDPVPVSTEGTEAGSLRPSMQTEPVQEIGERVVQHSASSASSLSRGSAVFVLSALETISSSKEARRSKPLKESAVAALDMVKAATSPDSTLAPVTRISDRREGSIRLASRAKHSARSLSAVGVQRCGRSAAADS